MSEVVVIENRENNGATQGGGIRAGGHNHHGRWPTMTTMVVIMSVLLRGCGWIPDGGIGDFRRRGE